jgi:hypothetical protein
MVWVLMLIGGRLETTEAMPNLPPEIWMALLAFVRHDAPMLGCAEGD